MFHTPAHKVAPSLPQAGQIVNDPLVNEPRVLTQLVCGSHGYIVSEPGESSCQWCYVNLMHAAERVA